MKNKILNGIIIRLAVLLLVNGGLLIKDVAEEANGYTYRESSFLYRMEDQDYARMIEMMYANEAYGAKPTETMEECYAVARYYEAASYYVAYAQDGQTEKASHYKEIMETQKPLMGEFAYAADEIDKGLQREGEGK